MDASSHSVADDGTSPAQRDSRRDDQYDLVADDADCILAKSLNSLTRSDVFGRGVSKFRDVGGSASINS